MVNELPVGIWVVPVVRCPFLGEETLERSSDIVLTTDTSFPIKS